MATKIPAFSTNCSHATAVSGGYWYIYLLSSGTITFTYAKKLEACIVGGGGGGRQYSAGPCEGGAGGEVLNVAGLNATAGAGYGITIGTGGAVNANGLPSSAFGYSASGGAYGEGGAPYAGSGANGPYAFNDSSLSRYGGAGGGGGTAGNTSYYAGGTGGAGGGGNGGEGKAYYDYGGGNAQPGTENTGGGGGGQGQGHGFDDDGDGVFVSGGDAAAGGSGIVILRGTEDDLLPVYFNGTQLSEVFFNDTQITGLIYGGVRLFVRKARGLIRSLMGDKTSGVALA